MHTFIFQFKVDAMKSKLLSTIAHTMVLFGKCWRNSIVRLFVTSLQLLKELDAYI